MNNVTVDDVVDYIIDRLSSGIYPIGSKLPPSRQLAQEIGVHRNTVAKAFRNIADLGLITTKQGRGTYVTSLAVNQEGRSSLVPQIGNEVESLLLKARQLGIQEDVLKCIIDDRISIVYQSKIGSAAFVECNLEDLKTATDEIELLTGFRLTPLHLDKLKTAPFKNSDGHKIIFTSLFHIQEVTDLLTSTDPAMQVVGVYTQPDELSLDRIAQIRADSRVGIVVSNEDGARRFAAQINTYTAATTKALVLPSDEAVKVLACEVDVMVYSRSRAGQLQKLDIDIPAIELSFHISKQSAARIIELLNASDGN